MENILISIIVPCYNQAFFLAETLDSILAQEYIFWECLIVNDGSTDNTEEISKKYTKKDKRFKYLYKQNGGLSSARNFGLDHSKGELIQFLDSDDLLLKTKLNKSIDKFDGNYKGNFVITDFSMLVQEQSYPISINKEYLNFKGVLFEWDYNINIPIHCGLFDRTFFETFRFNELVKAKEDWLMWVLLFHHNYSPIVLEKNLVIYRKHDKSMTMSTDVFKEHIKAIKTTKLFLENEVYQDLLLNLFKNSHIQNTGLKVEIRNLKSSFLYKLERKFKKYLKF